MATLAQLGEALRRADAAGNVEDARKLATAYAAMKAQTTSTSSALAEQMEPPAGAVPGSREYADWAAARARAGKALPQVSPAPPEDATRDLGSKFSAAYTAGVNAIPIAGPALLEKVEGMRGAQQGMSREDVLRETRISQEANPVATTAGAITGTVAPFVAAASLPVVSTILGVDVGAPLAANIVLGAGSQKVISHLDTLARGGDPNETIDILGADVKPEDIAAVAGAAGPLVGKALGYGLNKLGEKVIDPLVRTVKTATGFGEDAAQGAIGKTIAADVNAGKVLSAADEATALANGQPLANADRFGEATRTLARTAANADPNARATLSEFVHDRFIDQSARAKDWITRNTGAPTNLYAVQNNLDAAAKGSNNVAYKAAYSAPAAKSIWTPELEQLMQSSNFRSAILSAVKTSNEEAALSGAKAIQNPFIFNKNGAYQLRPGTTPNLEFWDHVQRALRRRAGVLARNPDAEFDAGQVMRARGQLNTVLDGIVPEFAQARGGAARWFDADDALEAGQKFVTSKPSDMDAARAAHAQFSPTEKKLFASGLASSLLDKIGTTPDSVNVINKIFASPQAREMIEMGMGKRAASELESFVRIEDTMQMLNRVVSGNSTTLQQQLAAIAGIGGTAATHTGVGYGIGATLGGGGLDPRNWGTKAWTFATLGALGRAGARTIGKKVDQSVLHQVAKLLSSTDPKALQRAASMATRNARVASAIEAIETGMSMLVRGAGGGAAAGAATEGTAQ